MCVCICTFLCIYISHPQFSHLSLTVTNCCKLLPFDSSLRPVCFWGSLKSAVCPLLQVRCCHFILYLCPYCTETWWEVQTNSGTALPFHDPHFPYARLERFLTFLFPTMVCWMFLKSCKSWENIMCFSMDWRTLRNKLNHTMTVTLRFSQGQLSQRCSSLCVTVITVMKYLSRLLYKE